MLAANGGECEDRTVDVVVGVGRRHLGPDAGRAVRHDGKGEGDDIEALGQEPIGHLAGDLGVAQHDRDDRVAGTGERETGSLHTRAEPFRVALEPAVQLRGRPEQVEHPQRRRGDDRGQRVAEQVRPRPLSQPLDDLLPAAGVATRCATHRLAEGPGHDVDPVGDAAVCRRATTAGSDEADRMGIVDHHHRVVAVSELANRHEIGDHTVHREHAVGGDQPVASVARLLQPLFQLRHVVVVIAKPSRLAEPYAVDDGRVVEGIADHAVLLVEDRLEEAAVRVEARRVEDRVLGAEEPADLALELAVHGLGAADEPHRRHAVPVGGEGAAAGLDQCRMVGESEVVVGAEVHHRPPVRQLDVGRLGRRDHPFMLVQAVVLQPGRSSGEVVEHRLSGGVADHQLFDSGPTAFALATRSS